ncbi:MAG: hypothetical protein HC892_23550 [Saprospiraceae bacterium]|nr:hypothetical protein [Saprospiraceae bacterium]
MPTGVVFYREGYFGNAIILQQDWAIRAIYTLFQRQRQRELLHHHVRTERRFSGAQLRKVWQQYSEVECELFLGFMLSCELCFEVETDKDKDRSKSFEERQFVAPQLMQKTPPATVVQFREGKPKRLFIRYQHTLLHYGIIQSFIVRTQYLAELRDIWQMVLSSPSKAPLRSFKK